MGNQASQLGDEVIIYNINSYEIYNSNDYNSHLVWWSNNMVMLLEGIYNILIIHLKQRFILLVVILSKLHLVVVGIYI